MITHPAPAVDAADDLTLQPDAHTLADLTLTQAQAAAQPIWEYTNRAESDAAAIERDLLAAYNRADDETKELIASAWGKINVALGIAHGGAITTGTLIEISTALQSQRDAALTEMCAILEHIDATYDLGVAAGQVMVNHRVAANAYALGYAAARADLDGGS